MRETITRCSKCKREDCDGRMWLVPDGSPEVNNFTVCTSKTEMRDGKRQHHFVMGHGCDWWIEVLEVVDT